VWQISATLRSSGIRPAVLGSTIAVKINVRSQNEILSEDFLIVRISDTHLQGCTALQSIGVWYKHANAGPLAARHFTTGRQWVLMPSLCWLLGMAALGFISKQWKASLTFDDCLRVWCKGTTAEAGPCQKLPVSSAQKSAHEYLVWQNQSMHREMEVSQNTSFKVNNLLDRRWWFWCWLVHSLPDWWDYKWQRDACKSHTYTHEYEISVALASPSRHCMLPWTKLTHCWYHTTPDDNGLLMQCCSHEVGEARHASQSWRWQLL